MYQEQRLQQMTQLLAERGQVSARDMVALFKVSKDTIRRDFSLLSQRGLAQRTHGGLIPVQDKPTPIFKDRLKQLTAAKKEMAKGATLFLEDDKVYFFDVSTTILELSSLVKQRLTIYSHSLDNAIMLSDKKELDFHLLGGRFYPENRFYYDQQQAQLLENISFDIAFIAAAGLANGKVSFADQEDKAVKELALKHAKKKILIAESHKCQQMANYILTDMEDFDIWITDKKPSPNIEEHLPKHLAIIY